MKPPWSIPSHTFDEILDTIDTIATEESDGVFEFDEQQLNYHEMKTLVANQITELYLNVMHDDGLTGEEKAISLIASMSYLAMQNFVLHYERERGK